MQSRLSVLDGWRTVSVGLVIFAHLIGYSAIRTDSALFFALSSYARLGVSIFFIISGFVITRRLMAESRAFGSISIPAFYIRRTIRIVPPLLFYVFGIVLLNRAGILEIEVLPFLRTLTFTCNFSPKGCGGYLGAHTWTLSAEEQFYLVAPAILAVFTPRFARPLAKAAASIALVVVMLFAVGLTSTAHFLSPFAWISAGVSLALLEPHATRIAAAAPGWIFGFLSFFVLVLWLLPASAFSTACILIAGVPAVSFILIRTISRKGLVSSALSWGPITLVGRSSYSIYLWQQLATYPFDGAGLVFYALSCIGCISGCVLFYTFVESRLIQFGATMSATYSSGELTPIKAP